MARVVYVQNDADGTKTLVYHCPGCGWGHCVGVPRWNWNGSLERPTFSPSVVYERGPERPRCHSYIRDGKIEYLPDSEHELKGKTVDLPSMEDYYKWHED